MFSFFFQGNNGQMVFAICYDCSALLLLKICKFVPISWRAQVPADDDFSQVLKTAEEIATI